MRKLTDEERIERFWKAVSKGADCWEWQLSRVNGYGQYWFRGKRETSHRLSYQFTYGEIPDGICVLHRCDNPSCVRPDHLFLGTMRDNTQDAIAKGRFVFPPKNHGRPRNHELWEQVTAMHKQGIRQSVIAAAIAIDQSHVHYILKRVTPEGA